MEDARSSFIPTVADKYLEEVENGALLGYGKSIRRDESNFTRFRRFVFILRLLYHEVQTSHDSELYLFDSI